VTAITKCLEDLVKLAASVKLALCFTCLMNCDLHYFYMGCGIDYSISNDTLWTCHQLPHILDIRYLSCMLTAHQLGHSRHLNFQIIAGV